MSGIIYHLFCTATGKVYIGQTWGTLKKRWSAHQKVSSGCHHLRAAILKYGPNRFVRSTLTSNLTTQEQMDAAEKYWIEYFGCCKNGYNIHSGGGAGPCSAETKEKLSRIHQGLPHKPMSLQARINNRKAHLGLHYKPMSLQGRANIKEAHIGQYVSPATAAKMSIARTGKPLSEEHRLSIAKGHGSRPFADQYGVVYETIGSAARLLGLDGASISRVLRGVRNLKSTGGYTFRYIGDQNAI